MTWPVMNTICFSSAAPILVLVRLFKARLNDGDKKPFCVGGGGGTTTAYFSTSQRSIKRNDFLSDGCFDALIVPEETTPPPRRESTLPVRHQELILNLTSESKATVNYARYKSFYWIPCAFYAVFIT